MIEEEVKNMNRKEIKEEAKAKIKGNKWNILWPILVIGVITSIISRIFGIGSFQVSTTGITTMEDIMASYSFSTTNYIGMIVVAIVSALLYAGYFKYVLNFVRTGKFEFNDILDTIKSKWLNILIATILVSIIVGLCTLAFVIPGIIMSLAYAMVYLLVIDTDVSGSDALKKSREMMKGYKGNYFVFLLSFIGWIILTPFTLGLLLIWLLPYMTVAEILYYDKLKAKQ